MQENIWETQEKKKNLYCKFSTYTYKNSSNSLDKHLCGSHFYEHDHEPGISFSEANAVY